MILDTIGELAQRLQVATRCSSAARSSTRAATTSSTRGLRQGDRLRPMQNFAEDCARVRRERRRRPDPFRARAGTGAARPSHRPGAPGPPRRGGARARRGQPRRPRPGRDRDRRVLPPQHSATCARSGWSTDFHGICLGRAASPRIQCAASRSPARPRSAGDQYRQHRRRRPCQDPDGRPRGGAAA